jgi:hypothetical protein
MTKFKTAFLIVIALILLAANFAWPTLAQDPQIKSTFKNGVTTVSMEPLKISGEKDNFYSLHVSPRFTYEGQQPKAPEFVTFELQTVVKARRLSPDLYVVFVIDGEAVFLSSNRWAVKNPVPGHRWVGERLAMRMPLGTFTKLTSSKTASIKMGPTEFEITDDHKRALMELTKRM